MQNGAAIKELDQVTSILLYARKRINARANLYMFLEDDVTDDTLEDDVTL